MYMIPKVSAQLVQIYVYDNHGNRKLSDMHTNVKLHIVTSARYLKTEISALNVQVIFHNKNALPL